MRLDDRGPEVTTVLLVMDIEYTPNFGYLYALKRVHLIVVNN
jgi:hypothetical protein